MVGVGCASVATHTLPAKAFWRGLAALVPGKWLSPRCVAAPVPVPWGGIVPAGNLALQCLL